MENHIEIYRSRHVRVQGGLILGVAGLLAYALWHGQVEWPLLGLCAALLAFLGAVGLTMLVRRPQAALWVQDGTLHWQEDSCLPFQRGWKGSIPVASIAQVRSTRTALTESFHYDLDITDTLGQQHPLPPNISAQTRGQRLDQLLATLRTHNPAITFEEFQAR